MKPERKKHPYVTCEICEGYGDLLPGSEHHPDLENRGSVRQCEACSDRRIAYNTAMGQIKRAKITEKFANCTFDNYDTLFPSATPSISLALQNARKYVAEFLSQNRRGLLIHGTMGVGKTHLAVSIIRELMMLYQIPCRFFSQSELFQKIKFTFDRKSDESTQEVLEPILEKIPVIVIDDLGLFKGEWVVETLSLILSARYDHDLTTIITTNFPPLPSLGSLPEDQQLKFVKQKIETLGDRITDRLVSRIEGTSKIIAINGADFRKIIGRY